MRRISLVLFLSVLILSLANCGQRGRSAAQSPQSQSAEDERTREKAAEATQKAKEQSREAAQKVDEAAQKVEHKAKVVAQGVKEGWNRDQGNVLDLNSASQAQLAALPGLNDELAAKIVSTRPFHNKHELVTRGILSEDTYQQVSGRVTVR